MRQVLLIPALVLVLIWAGPRPARAISKDQMFNAAVFSLGSMGFSTLAYYLWKNSPAQRAKGYQENIGPGEWYLAGYSGVSLLPSADWRFSGFPTTLNGRTAQNVRYEPAVLGGVKFGRFFDTLPWLGWEVETNFSRHGIRDQQARLAPPLPGVVRLPNDRFYIWDSQVNLLARIGFLKDKEVTFGRLQPYLGLGPGFEVIYATDDSAKNLAIEAMAGIRYLFTPALGLFCEYKYSYQFNVEIQQKEIPPFGRGTVTFDAPHHRVVLGVSYHFKNIFGN